MTHRTLPSASIDAPRLGLGRWIARVEQAFVQWQAGRLQQIPAEKLWAQAMQDTRSFAEIRRSRG